MCDICKELVACPVGQKRRVYITEPGKKFTDYYGLIHTDDGTVFVIDKYTDYTECFIWHNHYDENSVGYGSGVDNIKFCPFCGEELVK